MRAVSFSAEFKAEAVRLVTVGGKSSSEMTNRLERLETALQE